MIEPVGSPARANGLDGARREAALPKGGINDLKYFNEEKDVIDSQ